MELAPRICFFGDSLVAGTGDDACLGWVGRVCAAARRSGRDVTCYNLGVRRDTSADIRARWRREVAARLLPEHAGRLVFSFGVNDCAEADDGGDGCRVPPEASLAHAGAILAEARTLWPLVMVGVLPINRPEVDARARALSVRYAALCARLEVPYLPVIEIAEASPLWAAGALAGDGVHPDGDGYALLAGAVEAWPAWRALVGL